MYLLKEVTVPRYIAINETSELHIFVDASQSSYGACVFVANRVKEIRELTQFQSWRHVQSNMNIADLLSRGCTPQNMLDSKWWEGPRWLKNNREQWPANEINCEPKDVILEKRKSELVKVNTLKNIENSDPRRKHRIEMKFNTHNDTDEKFT
ncbi:DUF5641 domain-containing protein [Trichonephila clavipes]|nr:DUF5641 domain-containing protein [Trichonephila clavipes]